MNLRRRRPLSRGALLDAISNLNADEIKPSVVGLMAVDDGRQDSRLGAFEYAIQYHNETNKQRQVPAGIPGFGEIDARDLRDALYNVAYDDQTDPAHRLAINDLVTFQAKLAAETRISLSLIALGFAAFGTVSVYALNFM